MTKKELRIKYMIEKGRVVNNLDSIVNKFKFYVLGYPLIE